MGVLSPGARFGQAEPKGIRGIMLGSTKCDRRAVYNERGGAVLAGSSSRDGCLGLDRFRVAHPSPQLSEHREAGSNRSVGRVPFLLDRPIRSGLAQVLLPFRLLATAACRH